MKDDDGIRVGQGILLEQTFLARIRRVDLDTTMRSGASRYSGAGQSLVLVWRKTVRRLLPSEEARSDGGRANH